MAAMIAPRERGRYSGYLGAAFALATISGPLLGGLIVDTSWLGWRWCFFVGCPSRCSRSSCCRRRCTCPSYAGRVSIDYLGATLIVGGVCIAADLGLARRAPFAWGSVATALMVGGGLLLLALAVWREARAAEPIIPLRLFRNRNTALATVRQPVRRRRAVRRHGVPQPVLPDLARQEPHRRRPDVAADDRRPGGLAAWWSAASSPGPVATSAGWSPAASLVVAASRSSAPSTRTRRCGWSASGWPCSVSASARPCRTSCSPCRTPSGSPTSGAASSTVSFFRSLGGAIGVSALGALLGHQVTSLVAVRPGPARRRPRQPSGASGGIPDVAALPAPGARRRRARLRGGDRRTSSWSRRRSRCSRCSRSLP